VAIVVVLRMFSGQRWARLTLAAGLGVVGTLSLTIEPVLWLARGNSLTHMIAQAGITDLVFGSSRVLHVAAVFAGCVLMFMPSANAYFRTPRIRSRVRFNSRHVVSRVLAASAHRRSDAERATLACPPPAHTDLTRGYK
jgi:hypothetical protein